MQRTLRRWAGRAAIAAIALLAACSPPTFNSVDITGATYARSFELRDTRGERRSLQDFKGRVVVVFFGFTQCPDVCPTTLSDMAAAKKRLGSSAADLQVVFITLDPARDTAQVLDAYVKNFDPAFVALTGTEEEIARAAREFKVLHMKVEGRTPTSYSIDHTAASYVFDREGRVRLYVRHGQPAEAIAADLKQLL